MNELVHVILDEPQSGIRNMAVDEALLEESLESGTIFLRLYRWSEATVSLGYFQRPAEQQRDSRLANLPSVRRLSGGGAILHHHEQTYSCCLPPSHPLAKDPSQLYERIHAAFSAWVSEQGVDVARRGRNSGGHDEPFLCFQREAAPDLVVQDHKILGSAQRRRRGAVLQHGSLLLRASGHTPEIPGLCDLAPHFSVSKSATEGLVERLAQCLGTSSVVKDLPLAIRTKASELRNKRDESNGSSAQLQKLSVVGNSPD